MLRGNINALRMALTLLDDRSPDTGSLTRADLRAALQALASMANRASEAQSKFSPRTSQHTLQQNRLNALRVAEALIRARLHAPDTEPGAAELRR